MALVVGAVAALALLGLLLSWNPLGGSAPGAAGRSAALPSVDASPGQPPLKIGTVYTSPSTAPLSAYDPGGHYYPPNHPLLPVPTVVPARCYSSPKQAHAAGYGEALGPPQSLKVGGVYLLFVDLFDQCRAAAGALGFAVPCPQQLPNPTPGLGQPGCGAVSALFFQTSPPCVLAKRVFYLEQSGFAAPPGFSSPGVGGPSENLVFTAFRPTAHLDFELGYLFEECGGGKDLGRESIAFDFDRITRDAQWLWCPETEPLPLGGHLVLRWRYHGVIYQAAISGDQEDHRQVLRQVASLITLVGPD